MRKKKSFNGQVVAITGAGSGIGRALAVELDRRGARVSGSDVSEAGLEETASMCRGDMHRVVLDVGDREAVFDYADAVARQFGKINQIYNNAGIGFAATVLESEWADYEQVFRVNFNGVVHGTQAFLPHLIASGDGHVINLSSVNGFFAQPKMSHYCATKFAVRGFTETLRTEMMLADQPVAVTVVHPGGVATNIATSALETARQLGHDVTVAQEARVTTYTEQLLRLPASKAAEIIVDGVAKGKPRVRVGNDAIVIDDVVRLLPKSAARIAVAMERMLLRGEQT